MRAVCKNKFLNRTVLNTTVFICVFIAATLSAASPFIHLIIAPYMKVFLVWGFILVFYQVAMNYHKYLNKFYLILLLFTFSYVITILINREQNFNNNLKALMYMIIIFTLVFDYDPHKKKEVIYNTIKYIFLTFIITSFALTLVSFGTYVFSIQGHAMYNEQWVYYGMFENRLWGLYNPSTGSAINTLAILMILGYWIYYKTKSILLRTFFAIALVIHYFCLLLTNSRTALFTLIIGLGILVFFSPRYMGKIRYKQNKLKQIIISLFLSFGCCIIVFASVAPIRAVLSYAPGAIKYVDRMLDDSGHKKNKNKIEKEELTRLEELEERPGGVLTGRTVLWKAGIKTYFEAPLFGITRENISENVSKNLDDDYWLRDLQRGGLHNIFITVLVSSGAIGFCLFIIFIVLLVYKCFYYLISNKHYVHTGIVYALFTILAILMIMEFFESRILYQVSIFYVLFWCIAGLTLSLIDRPEESKIHEN